MIWSGLRNSVIRDSLTTSCPGAVGVNGDAYANAHGHNQGPGATNLDIQRNESRFHSINLCVQFLLLDIDVTGFIFEESSRDRREPGLRTCTPDLRLRNACLSRDTLHVNGHALEGEINIFVVALDVQDVKSVCGIDQMIMRMVMVCVFPEVIKKAIAMKPLESFLSIKVVCLAVYGVVTVLVNRPPLDLVDVCLQVLRDILGKVSFDLLPSVTMDQLAVNAGRSPQAGCTGHIVWVQ